MSKIWIRLSNQRMDPVRKEACVLSRMVVKLVDQDLELRLCHTHSCWIPILTHAREGIIAFLISFLQSSWNPMLRFARLLFAAPKYNGKMESADL